MRIGDGLPRRWPKRHQPLWQEDAEAVYQKEKKEAEEKMGPSTVTATQIMKSMSEHLMDSMIYGVSPIMAPWDGAEKKKKPRKSKPKECAHEFQDYVGFTAAFRFCVHCDQKKDM